MERQVSGAAGTALLATGAAAVLAAGAAWWWSAAPGAPPPYRPVAVELPLDPDTISRKEQQLAVGDTVSWEVPPATRYELQWVCVGDGLIELTIRGQHLNQEVVEYGCGSGVQTVDVGSSGERLLVFLSRPGGEAVRVQAQAVRR